MSNNTRFGLSQETLAKLNSVFIQHPAIESVLIYGSRAKGTYRHGSDIDLTLKGQALSFLELMAIENEIDDLLLPYMVDLSEYDQLENPELVAHIDRASQVVYVRDETASTITPVGEEK